MTDAPAYLSAEGVDEIRPVAPEEPSEPGAPPLPRTLKLKIGDAERDVPVSYWWKDAIETGVYTDPKTSEPFAVDADRIDTWVKNFKAMRKAGIDIPAPAGHTDDPARNLGFIVDAKRVGNRLRIKTQTIGDDAALIAARSRCSLYIHPNYTDAQGRHWGDVFLHSAFTSMPVVAGMGDFTPIAASAGAKPVPVFLLSRSPAMDLSKLRTALKAGPDVTDEQLIDQASAHIGDLAGKLAKAETDKATALSQGVTLQNKLAGMAPKEPDPAMCAMFGDTLDFKRRIAVEKGAIDDATATAIEKLFRDNGKPIGIALSVTPGSDDKPIASKLWDILASNKPTQVTTLQADGKSKTPAQGVQLAQGASGGQGANAESDAPKLDPNKPEDLAKMAQAVVKQYTGIKYPAPKAAVG